MIAPASLPSSLPPSKRFEIGFNAAAKQHPNPSNMRRPTSIIARRRPNSNQYAIPEAVAFHLIGVGTAKAYSKKHDASGTCPELALLAVNFRASLPNVSIRRCFPEIPLQALPMKWKRIKEDGTKKLKSRYHSAISYAVQNGIDRLWTDKEENSPLFYISPEEKEIYDEALQVSLATFELMPCGYNPTSDPQRRIFLEKGTKRMTKLRESRDQKRIPPEFVEAVVSLCSM